MTSKPPHYPIPSEADRTREVSFPVTITQGIPTYLRTPAAAAFLQVSPRTMESWRQRDTGPAWTRAYKGVLYKLSDLIRFAEDQRVTTRDQAA